MRTVLGLLGIVFLILGGVNLLDVIAAARPDKQLGAVFFAVLFCAVALVCSALAARGTAGFSRRRCPLCGRRNARQAELCRYCHRPLPEA